MSTSIIVIMTSFTCVIVFEASCVHTLTSQKGSKHAFAHTSMDILIVEMAFSWLFTPSEVHLNGSGI